MRTSDTHIPSRGRGPLAPPLVAGLVALGWLAGGGCLGSIDTVRTASEATSPLTSSTQSAEPAQEAPSQDGNVAVDGNSSGPSAPAPAPAPEVSDAGDGNHTIGPGYSPAPQMARSSQVPQGKVSHFTMESSKSQFFSGLDPSLNAPGTFSRDLWLYVPAQHQAGSAAPFIIVQDGQGYYQEMVPMLDNLIAAKQLPAMVAIFIAPGPGDGRGSERGLEYDTVSDKYVSFVEAEVLPKIEADFQLRLTQDPEGRATMGGSSGGAAAFTMAWFRPDLYHRVLTYSGTFVNQHPDATYPHGAWSYHEFLIAQAAAKPLRVFLEAGQNDNNLDAQFGDGMHSWLTANDRMSDVLAAKGFHYRYLYAQNAGHVDGGVVGQTLPETMMWLWRGYPIP